MNSQQPRPRQSASQGALRTPKNYIQENIARAKAFTKRHQATPMPSDLHSGKGRTNSQPAPKLGKGKDGGKKLDKPKLVPVSEEIGQSEEKRPSERFAEVVFGEKVSTTGTTYAEIAIKKAAFEEDQRRISGPKTPTSGPNVDNSKVSGRPSLDMRQTPVKSASQTPVSTLKPPTPTVPSLSVSPVKPVNATITPRKDPEIDTLKVEESGFPLPEPRQSLPLSQTYATNRKSLSPSQNMGQSQTPAAAEVSIQPEELKKSTPKWARPQERKEETPMQEIKLFAEDNTPMVVEDNFPPSRTPAPSFAPIVPSSTKQYSEPIQPPQPSPTPSPINPPSPSFNLPPVSANRGPESKPLDPVQTSPSPINRPAFFVPSSVPVAISPELKPVGLSPVPSSKPPSQSPTPKSILKKSAPISPQAIPLPEVEAANTDASDSDLSQHSEEAKAKAMLSTPAHKRKRFNAALLTEFDVPVEAFSDCDVYYDSQVLSQSAKRRKRAR